MYQHVSQQDASKYNNTTTQHNTMVISKIMLIQYYVLYEKEVVEKEVVWLGVVVCFV